MTESGSRRLSPEERKLQLLKVAVQLAEEVGYRSKELNIREIANRAGLKSHGLVLHYFGSVNELKNAIMQHAIDTENLEIIVQGLVTKNILCARISKDLKARALARI